MKRLIVLICFISVSSVYGQHYKLDTAQMIFKAKLLVLSEMNFKNVSSETIFGEIEKMDCTVLYDFMYNSDVFIKINTQDPQYLKKLVFNELLDTTKKCTFSDSLYTFLFVKKYDCKKYNDMLFLDSILNFKKINHNFKNEYILVYDSFHRLIKISGFIENSTEYYLYNQYLPQSSLYSNIPENYYLYAFSQLSEKGFSIEPAYRLLKKNNSAIKESVQLDYKRLHELLFQGIETH